MRRIERAFVILNGTAVIAGLALMAVVVGWNVAARYLWAGALPWADEVARYTMIWLTFLGSGLALREGAHVAIANAQEALPGPAQRGLRWLILLILFFFFAFMVWVGIDYMSRMAIQKSAALRLPMKWVYAAMPTGFALMILHLALVAPRYLRAGFQATEQATDEAVRG
ncbi:TRAP transporter small permease [Paracoccus sp. R12_1]|uniref:TRAP transporter small permease n=1 Tax=unclassified Paracoccus (in: a-proteobacteria) TaxID=2688777 RepID=UPI001ADB69D5|nr:MULTISPECIES: TRAP transporter small permease [unclassified Paracoccus (in: a-proteobacteria)]MBO9453978.1 TRAP transporter small permease [Paracoccus sp. R12_2]MBO9485675.1 TRAP transporter small permease [Paracoccus sp. R12_1]